ncbi:MAG: hypothetical protein HZB46_14595 [Solirubrobacterales bacterium]|nr:hypothetical protein [Solirubrobacterales bacterium]
MDVSRVSRNEWLAMLGGLLLAIGIFLPWYGTDAGNPNASIDGATGTVSCWDAHPILRWLLLAAAAAPFILTWIIVRGHKLSWPRGEMTAVVAIAAGGLIFYNGIIDKPGEPSSAISLKYGWIVALLGAAVMFFGSAIRASDVERARKPPGTI